MNFRLLQHHRKHTRKDRPCNDETLLYIDLVRHSSLFAWIMETFTIWWSLSIIRTFCKESSTKLQQQIVDIIWTGAFKSFEVSSPRIPTTSSSLSRLYSSVRYIGWTWLILLAKLGCSLQYRLIRWLVTIRFFRGANCFGENPEFFWNRGPLEFLVAPMTLDCWREILFFWCQGRCTIVIKFLWDITHTIATAIGCCRTTSDISDFSFTCIPTVDRCDV